MLNVSFALSLDSIGCSTFSVHTYILTPVKQLSPIKVSEEETVTLKEYKALQKENQRLKIENEILKKATAIFAKEQ